MKGYGYDLKAYALELSFRIRRHKERLAKKLYKNADERALEIIKKLDSRIKNKNHDKRKAQSKEV